MAVRVVVGDLFESRAQTWVNTVNTVGVMGKGVALEFKRRFPDMYEDYARRCERGEVRLGRPYLFRRPNPPQILNFPTKRHWRAVSRLRDIVAGLEHVERHYREWGIESLAVPPLGCGHGGLEWRAVGPTLYDHLARLDIPVELYAPFGTSHEQLQPEYLQLSLTAAGDSSIEPSRAIEPAWVALVAALDRIQSNPFRAPVGRVAFQKLAYFATAEGIPTGLEFKRSSYGPYAANLKPVISKLVNNDLMREESSGRMILMQVGPAFRSALPEYEAHVAQWDPALDRVVDLLARMTTRDAEVAASVHLVASELRQAKDARPSEQAILDEVMAWKQRRKPPFDSREVAEAIRGLAMLGWIEVEPSDSLPADELALAGI